MKIWKYPEKETIAYCNACISSHIYYCNAIWGISTNTTVTVTKFKDYRKELSVRNVSIRLGTSIIIKEYTLMRNILCVNTMNNVLVRFATSIIIKGYTLDRNLSSAILQETFSAWMSPKRK